MNLHNIVIKTSDIINTKWLGIRPFTCYFTKYELPKFKDNFCKDGFDTLGKIVLSLRSGEYIPKDNYSITEKDYIYLTVGNFSKGSLDLTERIFLENEVGQKYENIKVENGDLIITRSGTVGRVALFEIPQDLEEKIFIPSHHLAVIKTSTPEDHLFLKYYLSYGFCRDFFDALSTGKVQKEITNWSIRKIPIPISLNKSKLTEKFKKIDDQIRVHQLDNIPLQDSIDEVLSTLGIKTKSSGNYRTRTLIPSLTDVAKNKALRIGAEYNDFWLFHNGHLFEGTDETIKIVPLKEIMKLAPKNTLKKGQLEEPRILIDFAQVESPNGKVIDFDNIVIELGSDRIEFGHCDFLTNKLRPYLGYTILNSPELNLIGTTEFIPFQIRDEKKVMTEYIRYLLLSTEYLGKSKFLMSGKEHPRIISIDILNIRVPLPDPEVQQKIVEEISKREAEAQKAREEIKKLRASIDETILKELEKL